MGGHGLLWGPTWNLAGSHGIPRGRPWDRAYGIARDNPRDPMGAREIPPRISKEPTGPHGKKRATSHGNKFGNPLTSLRISRST